MKAVSCNRCTIDNFLHQKQEYVIARNEIKYIREYISIFNSPKLSGTSLTLSKEAYQVIDRKELTAQGSSNQLMMLNRKKMKRFMESDRFI